MNPSTPALSKLKTELKNTLKFDTKVISHNKFDPKAFVKAAKELQKTLHPEEILINADSKISKSN